MLMSVDVDHVLEKLHSLTFISTVSNIFTIFLHKALLSRTLFICNKEIIIRNFTVQQIKLQ